VKPLSASKQGVKSFEELHIFQSARKLCGDVWDFTRTVPAAKDFAFTTQIRRSALSILSNIAEGFERNSRKELVQFLSIAKGSCGELRAQMLVALDQKYISKDEHNQLRNSCLKLNAGLANLMSYLRNNPRQPHTAPKPNSPTPMIFDQARSHLHIYSCTLILCTLILLDLRLYSHAFRP
jgi:four helix bundle protein